MRGKLSACAPHDDAVRLLGPAESRRSLWCAGAIAIRLLAKSARGYDLSAYMRDWLAGAPKAKGDLKLEVDIDPVSFL